MLTIGRTKVEREHRVSDQQNSLRAHSQRTDLEQRRIYFLRGMLNTRRKQQGGRPYLKLISEFHLKPRYHRRFRPTTSQEQEILEIYDLRENGKPLVQAFGIFRRLSIRRDKLKFPHIDSFAASLDEQGSGVI